MTTLNADVDELPAALQQRTIAISQDRGIDRYFTALVGYAPEAEQTGSP